MRTRISWIALLLCATPLMAQQHKGPSGHASAFDRHLFNPEMVMMSHLDIGLKDAQREQIQAEIKKAQGMFTDMQWKLSGEQQKLEKILMENVVDETRALAQVDQILQLEREVKRTHVALLVRIHNLLTPEQREKLKKLHHDD